MDLIEKRAVNPLCAEVFKKSGNTSFRTDKPHISRCDATGIKGADTIRIMFVPAGDNGNEILFIRMYLFNCGRKTVTDHFFCVCHRIRIGKGRSVVCRINVKFQLGGKAAERLRYVAAA